MVVQKQNTLKKLILTKKDDEKKHVFYVKRIFYDNKHLTVKIYNLFNNLSTKRFPIGFDTEKYFLAYKTTGLNLSNVKYQILSRWQKLTSTIVNC